MDGYKSHWIPEMKAAAAELSIELISMPPNKTDEIQPLDVGVFGALQKMTDNDWESDNSVSDYLNHFQQSWCDFSPATIRKAFYAALALEDGALEDNNSIVFDQNNALNSIFLLIHYRHLLIY